MELSFDEAVAYIKQAKGKAFAFVPALRGTRTVGGAIWFLEYNEVYESNPVDNFEYILHYQAGEFHSSEGEEDTYTPREIPDEAKRLKFRATKADAGEVLLQETQMALEALERGAL